MIPSVQQVYAAAAAHLGDDTQAYWTNSILQPHYVTGYGELFRALEMAQSERVRREGYYNLPANTGYLDPVTAGMTNVGEVHAVDERGGITSVAISGVLPATPNAGLAQITVVGHPFNTGQQITVNGITGISDDVNDIWTITVQDADHVLLNGCTCFGTYASGGAASISSENFVPLIPQTEISMIGQTPSDRLSIYAWEEDILRFPPANTVRQVRITYTISGNAPLGATASVGVDDSLAFLSLAAAWRLARAKDRAIWTDLQNDAAVQLNGIIGTAVRNLFDTPFVRPRFRAKRNRYSFY